MSSDIKRKRRKDKIPQRKTHAKITRIELIEKLSASTDFKIKCMKFIIIKRIELNFQHFINSLFLKGKKNTNFRTVKGKQNVW